MPNRRFVLPLFVAACGGSPTPAPTHANVQPIPSATVETPAGKVSAPSNLAVWLHVEHPEPLAALMDRVSPPTPDASCAKGDPRACLALIDPRGPVDVAYAPSMSGDDADALSFSVGSAAAFRAAAEHDFEVTQPRAGRLELRAKANEPDKKAKPVVCDITGADGPSHRVVCGTDAGIAMLGPWLRTSPRPATTDGLARIEVLPGPVVAAADKQWPGDTLVQRETRLFAHDFGGATLKLTGGDAGPISLDIDVHMQDSRSRWTKVLLAPAAGTSAIPDTFARLPADTTAATYLPGGGPIVALLDQPDALKDFTKLDPTQAKPALDEARAVLGRPMVCGYVVDLDAGRAALAKLRKAAEKDKQKAEEGLNQALAGHVVCGIQETAKAAEQLARNLIKIAAPSGDTYAVRAAQSLGLPKGSFLVETTHRKTTKAGTTTQTDTMLAVADGSTTWLIWAEDTATDARRAAHLGSQLLARPTGPVTAFPVGPGTVLSAYATTFFGGFFWDLAMHSIDDVEKTLATSNPGRLQISMTQQPAASGGVVSLRLSTDAASLPTFARRASVLALPIALLLATMSAGDSSSK